MPDAHAEGDRAHPGDRRASSSSSSTRGFAYAVEGDVYFRVAQLPRVRPALGPAAGPGRGAGAEPAQGGSARLRALEGEQAGRGHRAGTRRGAAGRPGWHIECSVMAEELLGEAFEIHGGGLDLVFPHHENELAQSRALGHAVRAASGRTTGCSSFTGEKMSKSVGNIATIREVLDEWGRETLLVFFLGGPLAQADRLLRRDDGAGGGAGRGRSATSSAAPSEPRRRLGRVRRRRSTTTSTRPRRSRCCTSWRDHELLRRGARRSSGSARSPSSERGAGGGRRARRAARRGARRPRLRAGRPAARRDRGGRLGDARRGRRLHARPASGDRRPRLRPARRARGAARPARGARAARRPSGPLAAEPWLAEAKAEARGPSAS